MSSVGTWFFKNRALAFGVMASGSSLGGVIFPIMVQRVVNQKGFGWAMRASAFLILGLLIYANLTVKSRIPPRPTPWKIGDFLKPYLEVPFLLTVVASFFFFFGMFLPFTFVILSAQYHGMNPMLAGYLLSILNAVSIFGRILPGKQLSFDLSLGIGLPEADNKSVFEASNTIAYLLTSCLDSFSQISYSAL